MVIALDLNIMLSHQKPTNVFVIALTNARDNIDHNSIPISIRRAFPEGTQFSIAPRISRFAVCHIHVYLDLRNPIQSLFIFAPSIVPPGVTNIIYQAEK